MEYTLKDLLNDKHLRAAVVKEDFSFRDGNGVVTCLDFENETMLKNHRAFYDFLCETGGEALLNKVLAQGNTCLTDDPNAANSGVRKIKGTDKFFLMTNAGESKVLASILWGILGLSEVLDDFDPDLVCVSTAEDEVVEEADEEYEDDDEELLFDDMVMEDEEEDLLPAHTNVSVIQKDGKYALYDNDESKFIAMSCPDAPGGEISAMAVCERLEVPELRENQFDNWMEEDSRVLGWKFKLDEASDALWGWISADCSRVYAPKFVEIEAHCDGCNYSREHVDILAWTYTGLYRAGVGTSMHELICGKEIPRGDRKICFERYNEWNLISWSRFGMERGYLCVNGKPEPYYLIDVNRKNGVLHMKTNGAGESYLCGRLGVQECMSHVKDCNSVVFSGKVELEASDYTDGFEIFSMQDDDTFGKTVWYAVRRKDAYWGVVKMKNGKETVAAPFAFTHMTLRAFYRADGMVAVEQFGKWGVYNVRNDAYVIPCDYDSVSAMRSEECLEVRRMNFVGKIGFDGEWREHLRREEG